MSIYYYPYIFDSKNYLEKKGNNPHSDELLTECTDFKTEFPIDTNNIADHFILDEQLQGSLPEVISIALEEEIVDIESEDEQGKMQKMADILGRLYGRPTSINLEPYIGFITESEVMTLCDFLKDFSFQDESVEDLKSKMIFVLTTAQEMNKGIIYVMS